MSNESRVQDWLDHGWNVAVFEKTDGSRIAAPLSRDEITKLEIGKECHEHGWRCKLVAKPQTVQEALDALDGVEIPA